MPLTYETLPEHMRDGMRLYIEHCVPPGSFLEAVLSNDLREACVRADAVNRDRLFDFVAFLFNHAPSSCWGSPEAVREWVEGHALERKQNADAQEGSRKA